MADETFKQLSEKAKNTNNIRKVLDYVIFLAPSEVDFPTSMRTGTGEIASLPEGYFSTGLTTKDGVTFGREIENAEVESFGQRSAVRTDIVKDNKNIQFTAQEIHKRQMIELIEGVDLSEVTVDANGQVTWDDGDIPIRKNFRAVLIAQDIDKASGKFIFDVKGYPNVTVESVDGGGWNEEEQKQQITLKAQRDSETGATERRWLLYPTTADLEALGFTSE